MDHIHETRKFLLEVMEEDVTIPESPLFMSQDFVLEALYREVIARNGAVVKAGILATINDAFNRSGRNSCPFIMGFGNKKSDADAYSQSGVLPEYIFIINTSSQLKSWDESMSDMTFQTYLDPKLLGYIDSSFRRPGMAPVFDVLEPAETVLTATEFIKDLGSGTDDEAETKDVSSIDSSCVPEIPAERIVTPGSPSFHSSGDGNIKVESKNSPLVESNRRGV